MFCQVLSCFSDKQTHLKTTTTPLRNLYLDPFFILANVFWDRTTNKKIISIYWMNKICELLLFELVECLIQWI